MKEHSDESPDWDSQRMKIIGLGESSIRKSYYPELQQRLDELLKNNEDLNAAYEELTATQEELQQNYQELTLRERELQESRNLLRAIFDGSPDMIFIHNADGHIIDVNENGVRNLGFTREEIMHVPPEVTSGEGYTTAMAMEKMEITLQGESQDFEWGMKRKDGVEFPVEIRLRKLELVNGAGISECRILAMVRDITEVRRAATSLEQARKKMNLLNSVTFQDIQSAVFSISAYHLLIKQLQPDQKISSFLDKQAVLIQKITSSLIFARNYQDMGIRPPRWQNVSQTFLFAISHLDFLTISHNLETVNLDVYADPLLEKVFYNLMENVIRHGSGASKVRVWYREKPDGLILFVEDNGAGIPQEEKHMIFDRGYGKDTGLGLFLVREILSITGISIKESGAAGNGTRFEIHIPKGAYRFDHPA